jgi:hypothetical protein
MEGVKKSAGDPWAEFKAAAKTTTSSPEGAAKMDADAEAKPAPLPMLSQVPRRHALQCLWSWVLWLPMLVPTPCSRASSLVAAVGQGL